MGDEALTCSIECKTSEDVLYVYRFSIIGAFLEQVYYLVTIVIKVFVVRDAFSSFFGQHSAQVIGQTVRQWNSEWNYLTDRRKDVLTPDEPSTLRRQH